VGNPYPANFEDAGGTVRITGLVDFTDAGNQPGGGAAAVTWSTPVVVDDATLKQLPTGSSVVVVPAPGSGKVTLALAAYFIADFAVAYTGIDADGSSLSVSQLAQFQNLVSASDTSLTGLLTATNVADGAQIYQFFRAYAARGNDLPTAITTPQSNVIGAVSGNDHPLYLGAGNTLDFTGGDAANTLTVSVLYTVLSV
jgi:hypothetical protein